MLTISIINRVFLVVIYLFQLIEIHPNGFVLHYNAYEYLPLADELLPLLRMRFCPSEGYSSMMVQNMGTSIDFTLSWLSEQKYLKKAPKKIKIVKLWDNYINLGEYEGIRNGITTALIKYLRPVAYKNMVEGRIWSSLHLTVIHEAVEYTMEYLKKNDLLINGGTE